MKQNQTPPPTVKQQPNSKKAEIRSQLSDSNYSDLMAIATLRRNLQRNQPKPKKVKLRSQLEESNYSDLLLIGTLRRNLQRKQTHPPSKKLIALISTEGKPAQQVAQETWQAYQNYQAASSKRQQPPPKQKEKSKPPKSPKSRKHIAQLLVEGLNRAVSSGK